MIDINEYTLKKVLKVGGNSQSVHLLSHKINGHLIIKKKYNPHKPDHVTAFKNEIKILRHLNHKGCHFIPQLYQVNEAEFTFYVSYCGEIPKRSPRTSEKIRERMKVLDKQYGVYRVSQNNVKQYEVYFKNVCQIDNKIFLIDFGATRWKMR